MRLPLRCILKINADTPLVDHAASDRYVGRHVVTERSLYYDLLFERTSVFFVQQFTFECERNNVDGFCPLRQFEFKTIVYAIDPRYRERLFRANYQSVLNR